MKKLLFLALFLVAGCSSVRQMRGTEARPVGGNAIALLKITVEPVPELSAEGYRLLNVYFRNLNESWLEVKDVGVEAVEGAPHFKIVVGRDLDAWRKSMALDLDLRMDREKETKNRKRLIGLKNALDSYKTEDYVNGPFRLPSMLQTRKWLLLQITPGEEIKEISLALTLTDTTRQIFTVRAGANR